MTEDPKEKKARGPSFVVSSTVPDGDMKTPEKIGWNRPRRATARGIAASFAAVQAARSGRQERQRDAQRRGTHAHPSAERIAFESRATSTNRYSSLVQYIGTSGYWKLFRAMAL